MTLPVFYRPEQVAQNSASYSPSAAKPKLVLQDWTHRKLDIEVLSFEPATYGDLCLAHDPGYVDAVLNLQADNGFDNRDPEVAASLPYTTGSLLAAAEHAVLHRAHTCSLTSGFHHAGYSFGGGYCTFNGLMVAAIKLQEDGLVNKVGILDCDAHYGNGTQDIIEHLDLKWIKHFTAGRHFVDARDAGQSGGAYLRWLDKAVTELQDCDLIIYQAGADPHIKDPLGGILSEIAMHRRDMMVREAFEGKPLAWNLAGGYQRDRDGGIGPVLRLHRTTAQIFGA